MKLKPHGVGGAGFLTSALSPTDAPHGHVAPSPPTGQGGDVQMPGLGPECEPASAPGAQARGLPGLAQGRNTLRPLFLMPLGNWFSVVPSGVTGQVRKVG